MNFEDTNCHAGSSSYGPTRLGCRRSDSEAKKCAANGFDLSCIVVQMYGANVLILQTQNPGGTDPALVST